jgi:hypothetical protein
MPPKPKTTEEVRRAGAEEETAEQQRQRRQREEEADRRLQREEEAKQRRQREEEADQRLQRRQRDEEEHRRHQEQEVMANKERMHAINFIITKYGEILEDMLENSHLKAGPGTWRGPKFPSDEHAKREAINAIIKEHLSGSENETISKNLRSTIFVQLPESFEYAQQAVPAAHEANAATEARARAMERVMGMNDGSSIADTNWIIYFDENKGMPYYYKSSTEETVWDMPEDVETVLLTQGGGYRKGTQKSRKSKKKSRKKRRKNKSKRKKRTKRKRSKRR